MRFNKSYLALFIILFLIETYIAVFVHDTIIRPYIGDVLVVILMYTFIRGIVSKDIRLLPVYLFLFATFIELLQYFKIVEILSLENNKLAKIVIGSSFDFKDILCYLVGAVILVVIQRLNSKVSIKEN